jgi:hypothetical protein
VDNNHLSARLVGLHHAVSFLNLIEAKDSDRLDVEPTHSGVRRNLLKRHVRKRETGRAKDEAPEEGQVDAAGHLQQRVDVGDRIETPEPSG